MSCSTACTYVTKFFTISLYLMKFYVTYCKVCNSVIIHIQRNPPKIFWKCRLALITTQLFLPLPDRLAEKTCKKSFSKLPYSVRDGIDTLQTFTVFSCLFEVWSQLFSNLCKVLYDFLDFLYARMKKQFPLGMAVDGIEITLETTRFLSSFSSFWIRLKYWWT